MSENLNMRFSLFQNIDSTKIHVSKNKLIKIVLLFDEINIRRLYYLIKSIFNYFIDSYRIIGSNSEIR